MELDDKKIKSSYIGKIYNTNNFGKIKVLEVVSREKTLTKFLCEFIDDGTKIISTQSAIRSGQVKNPNVKNVYGVGYIGVGEYDSKNSKDIYKKWTSMLQRCYDLSYQQQYSINYYECFVDSRWHNFQNFCEDFKNLEGYDKYIVNKSKYSLDKDYKIKGNKIYSKENCILLEKTKNSAYISKHSIYNTHGVRCFTDDLSIDMYFNSVKEAIDYFKSINIKIYQPLIQKVCTGERGSHGKFNGKVIKWQYFDILSKKVKDYLNCDILNIIKILNKDKNKGYLVGGSIRDIILDYKCNDYDFVTDMSFEDIRENFDTFELCKDEKYGTIGIIFNGRKYDVARMRKDFYRKSGDKPFIEYTKNLYDDYKRRDFKICAMYFDGNNIIEFDNSLRDIRYHIIKTTDDANKTFLDDPIRILRCIKFCLRYNFKPSYLDMDSILTNMNLLKNIPKERVVKELFEILNLMDVKIMDNPIILNLLKNMFGVIIGDDFYNIVNYDQNNPHHNLTLDDHTIMTMVNCPKGVKFKITALLHDLGKYHCAKLNEKTGFTRYIGHEKISVEIADKIMKNLKLPNKLQEEVKELIDFHMVSLSDVYHRDSNYRTKWVNKKIYQLKYNSFNDLMDFAKADKSGKPCDYEFIYDELKEIALEIYNSNEYLKSKSDLKIDKRKLVALLQNLELMKDLVDALCLYVIKTGRNNEEDLIKRAKQYIKDRM